MRVRRSHLILALSLGLGACSQPQATKALAMPPGQLFCAFQLAGGGQMVAGLLDAAASAAGPEAGVAAVIATGATKAQVDADCQAAAANVAGATGAVPVSPPTAAAAGTIAQVAVMPPRVAARTVPAVSL